MAQLKPITIFKPNDLVKMCVSILSGVWLWTHTLHTYVRIHKYVHTYIRQDMTTTRKNHILDWQTTHLRHDITDTQAASEMSNIGMQQPSVITYGH